MHNNRACTLLFPQLELPPFKIVAREFDAKLRSTGSNSFRLSFPDRGTLVVRFWIFEEAGDEVSNSLSDIAAQFRKPRLRAQPERRRTRILSHLRKSNVVTSLGTPPPRFPSPQALRYIDALATRTSALVYDVDSLHTCDGHKLLTVDGFVSDEVPAGYPEIPQQRRRSRVTRKARISSSRRV